MTATTSEYSTNKIYVKTQFTDDEVNHMYTASMLLQMYMTHEDAVVQIKLLMDAEEDVVFKCTTYSNNARETADQYLNIVGDYYNYRPPQECTAVVFTSDPLDGNTPRYHKVSWSKTACSPEHIRSYLFMEGGLAVYREKFYTSNFHYKNEIVREEMSYLFNLYSRSIEE